MPTSEHAPLVAEKLGVRRAWLLDDELPMRPRLANMAEKGSGYTTAEDFSLSREEFKLISDYRSLPHSVRGTLEQLLETVLKEDCFASLLSDSDDYLSIPAPSFESPAFC